MSDRISGAAMVHLENELGSELAQVIFDPANLPKVRELAQQMLKDALPTTMTVGGRVYDLFGFLRGDEKSVKGDTMVIRAKEMNANLGKEECEHLLKNQDDIPVVLRGKVVFVFTDWRHPDLPEFVAYVYWGGDGRRWVQVWGWLDSDWVGLGRVLRRK